jgi:hypothetical protein
MISARVLNKLSVVMLNGVMSSVVRLNVTAQEHQHHRRRKKTAADDIKKLQRDSHVAAIS